MHTLRLFIVVFTAVLQVSFNHLNDVYSPPSNYPDMNLTEGGMIKLVAAGKVSRIVWLMGVHIGTQ